jgi:hypothetical protein
VKDADLRWAAEVAETFLQAVVDGDVATALSLGTPAFQKLCHGGDLPQDREAIYHAKMRLYDYCGYDRRSAYKEDPARCERFQIDRKEIAPKLDEAVFEGKILGTKRSDRFRLIVSQEPQGKWRVEVFRLEGRQL